MIIEAMSSPCAECPWRRDVPAGRFPADRFRDLASTAEDASFRVFQCHKSTDDRPIACSGAILQNSAHNLTIRMARSAGLKVDRPEGVALFSCYRDMAVANGVSADDQALARCRADDDR